ncbi:hypothetical protein CPC08DRAFT_823442, partial [Agrocybe pediades]
MFIESVNQIIPTGPDVLEGIVLYVGFAFADALLVWRCFHACGRSYRRALLPMLLLIVEHL